MAIDTKAKRASAIGWGLRSLATLPPPDNTIDAADRAHVAYSYALVVVVVSSYLATYEYVIPLVEQTYSVMSNHQQYDVPVVEQTYDIRRR